MNEIIQSERNVTINGLACRAQNVIADIDTHWISNQTIIASKYFIKGAMQYRITVQMRFDDQCKNGHSSFAITGEIDMKSGSRWIDDCSGCIHDEIAAHFPELAPLIKWHLMSTDGPMHYVANTCYRAGNLDCHGRAKGQVSATESAVRFGGSPVTIKVRESFFNFLRTRQGNGEFIPVSIAHGVDKSGYKFADKYTFAGYGKKWHECPFDTLIEATEWSDAMRGNVEFVTIPTAYSEGKEREFDAARHAAIWPDATDAQLSLPRAELEELLNARLPGLLAEFKSAMVETCGFIWSV